MSQSASGTVANGSPWGLIASLGSAAAAVVVVGLFMTAIKSSVERRDAQMERFIAGYEKLTRDNMDVMKEYAAALRKLEDSVRNGRK